MIKAYKVMQLLRGANGQQFDLEHQTFTGKISKIDETLAETYNSNCLDSGKLYVEDPEITKTIFTSRQKKEITNLNPPPSGSGKTQEQIDAEKKAEKERKKKEEEKKSQAQYDKRKAKMIEAGFVFNPEPPTFTKGKKTITALELSEMTNLKYGKLLKS